VSRAAALALLLAIGVAPRADAIVHWWQPGAVAGFGGLRSELQRLADSEGRARLNHFCAVVQDVREPPSATSEGDRTTLSVYWREAGRILSYGPSSDGRLGPGNQDEGAGIDLRYDVVATERQIAGSTNRVTRAFVDGIIRHCRMSGTRLLVIRRR